MPDAASPASQFREFANDDLSPERLAKAPAAMYFVISVFPISMTSGTLPPASVASNLPRWSGHVWYCTSTLTPGCAFWNAAFVDATRSGQPDCASTWSQTVILLADARAGESVRAAAVETATRAATSARLATKRAFIDGPPSGWTAYASSAPSCGRTGVVRCGRQVVQTSWPRRDLSIYH